jgi:hypothetical protein
MLAEISDVMQALKHIPHALRAAPFKGGETSKNQKQ